MNDASERWELMATAAADKLLLTIQPLFKWTDTQRATLRDALTLIWHQGFGAGIDEVKQQLRKTA